jgi:hypothetical protein
MFVNFTAIKNVIKNESFKVSPRKVMSGTILESYNEDEEVIKRMQREVQMMVQNNQTDRFKF